MENTAVIYGLTSMLEQNSAKQKEGLIAYAKEEGLDILGQYWEETLSYKPQDRIQLKRLISAIQHQNCGCVLIWKLNYFACNLSHLLKLLREFEKYQIHFISVQDQLNTKNQHISTIIAVIEAILSFEAALKGQRVKIGIAAAKAMGKKVGRPPSSPHMVEMIEELAATTSLSIRKIASETGNRISDATIGRITKRVRDKLNGKT